MSDESVELDFTYLNSLSHKSECVSVDFHSEDSLLIADFHFHSFAICNSQFEIISRIMLLIIGKRMIGICKKIENNSDDMIREVHEVARNFLCMNELNLVDC